MVWLRSDRYLGPSDLEQQTKGRTRVCGIKIRAIFRSRDQAVERRAENGRPERESTMGRFARLESTR